MRRCSSTRSGSVRFFPLAFTSGCNATNSSQVRRASANESSSTSWVRVIVTPSIDAELQKSRWTPRHYLIDWRRGSFLLWQEIHWIRQLEHSLRVAALQVAFLITHAEDNREPAIGDLASFRRLEIHRARERRTGRQQDDFVPVVALL